MSRVGEAIRQEQEQQIEQNEMEMAWQQKQLEEQQQQEYLLEIAKTRNMFEWQAIQDAIYYSKRLRAVEGK
jgi:hypothetical protein